MFNLEGKKLIADFLGIEYDFTECDYCGRHNPETFKYSRLTKCCSAKKIGEDEEGNYIWDKPKNFFYAVPPQGDGIEYTSIGKNVTSYYNKLDNFNLDTWDTLMSVVEKIEKDYSVSITNSRCCIHRPDGSIFFLETEPTKKESLAKLIINYLKWLKKEIIIGTIPDQIEKVRGDRVNG